MKNMLVLPLLVILAEMEPAPTCLLVLTNEGSVNYVTGLPPCGSALLPWYLASEEGDRTYARFLEAQPQRVALVESDHTWVYDGRPFHEVFLHTATVLERTLPHREIVSGRTLMVYTP